MAATQNKAAQPDTRRRIVLPEEPTKPRTEFKDFLTLIYGAPKIGKSTFCSKLSKPFFIDTESGLRLLSALQLPVDSWESFKEVYAALKAAKDDGTLKYETIIVDTVDNLYQYCSEYICRSTGVIHESDLDYGKGWAMTKKEFTVGIAKLRQLGLGVIFTSHANFDEITTRTGKFTKASPSMSKQCRSVIEPTLDYELFATMEAGKDGEEVRVLKTKPSQFWVAGEHSGKLPETIPLDVDIFMSEFYKTMGKDG